MKTAVRLSIVMIGLTLWGAIGAREAAALGPRRDVLGVRLEMSEAEAHNVLAKIGELRNDPDRRNAAFEQVWVLRDDPRFSHVILGLDKKQKRVRYVTAVAREGAPKRMRYSEVADLKKAQREVSPVSYSYTWEVKPGKGERAYFLIATGRDPQYLTYFSIKRHF